jgi:hypothetical protein
MADPFHHLRFCAAAREIYKTAALTSLAGDYAASDPCFSATVDRGPRTAVEFDVVFLDARMESFLRGHVEAFHAWQGGVRLCLYDNLKSAVLERRGDAIRFHPTLLELARCYGFEPRAAAVARGNEKARASYYTSFVWSVVMGTRRVEPRQPGRPLAIV